MGGAVAMTEIDDLRNLIRPAEGESDAISDLWSAWLELKQGLQVAAEAREASPVERLGPILLTWPDSEPRELPPSVTRGLFAVLGTLAQGDAVAVVPADNELTTQEAADLLGVSRPSVVKLIDQQKLSCRWVGSHRRLRVEDVLNYRRVRQIDRRESLNELVEESERLKLRYSEDDQES
jgi:excisionase family DNA binding protein